MRDIRSHFRVNDILLGPLERPALRWLAAHMPAWVTPDILTGVGVFGSFLIFFSYILSNIDKNFLWLASLGFVINWFGDSLDGTLARHRHIERPVYGFFIDHTVDAFDEMLVFLGLGLTPYVNFNIACLALLGYLLLSILTYVRTCVTGEFRISFGKLGPTEIRVIAILLNTAMYIWGVSIFRLQLPWNNFIDLSYYDLAAAAIAGILFSIFIVSGLNQARKLARLGG